MELRINGQHEHQSIESVLLNEPCYHQFLLGQDNLRTRMLPEGMRRFLYLTKFLHNLKLKCACQICGANVATHMAVQAEQRKVSRGGRPTQMKHAKQVTFCCGRCTTVAPGIVLRPSTLSWPQVSPNDKFGAYTVRTALLNACGVPQLHNLGQVEMEAFFADLGNVTLTA